MPIATTLSLYILRQFLVAVLVVLAALSLLVMLFDFIELLRVAAKTPDAGFALVAQIAALRLPYYMLQLLPFAVLLGGMMAFWRLTRSSELIVARAAGISAWQFLAAPIAGAVALGLLATGVVSPLSSSLYRRATQLSAVHLHTGGSSASLAGGQLWLRQSDRQLMPQGLAILHARQVHLDGKHLSAADLSIFRLDSQDRLLARVEAQRAELGRGEWHLQGARAVSPDHPQRPGRPMDLPTDLSVGRIQQSFQSPDTFSVWALPRFIETLHSAGFSSVGHRLHFQALLALPLLCGTMALVAAGFSMRPARRGGVARVIGAGVAAGFALFTASKIAEEFGLSGALPPALAAWVPAAAGLLLSLALLLHLEDG